LCSFFEVGDGRLESVFGHIFEFIGCVGRELQSLLLLLFCLFLAGEITGREGQR
jgi:hypothetical protein